MNFFLGFQKSPVEEIESKRPNNFVGASPLRNPMKTLRQYFWIIAFLGFGLALLLRLPPILHPGIWADEIFSLAMATGHSLEHPVSVADSTRGDYAESLKPQKPSWFHQYVQHGEQPAEWSSVIRAVQLSDTNPPLYYLLLNAWTRFAGTSDAALRSFSTIWALACFPLLWGLGRKFGGTRTAWTACILFAFSPPGVYFATEGRMYSLLWFLGLALAWLSLKLGQDNRRMWLYIVWGLTAAIGMLTHYFFVFVFIACFAWLWLHSIGRQRINLVVLLAVIGLLILPWYLQVPESLSRWRVTGGWLDHPLGWKQLVLSPLKLAWGLLSGFGIWGGSWWADGFTAGLYAVLVLLVLQRKVWNLFLPRKRLVWLWLLATCLGPPIFDLLRDSQVSTISRYAVSGLPAALLLAGIGISRLKGWIHGAFLVTILLSWMPGILSIYNEPVRHRDPFVDIADHLQAGRESSDIVLVHSIPSGVLGVARYLDDHTELVSWVVQLGNLQVPEDTTQFLEGRCRVVLVKTHYLGKPSPAEIWLREHALLEKENIFNPEAKIYYFHLNGLNGRTLQECQGQRDMISRPPVLSEPS